MSHRLQSQPLLVENRLLLWTAYVTRVDRSARCVTRDTRNMRGHDPGSFFARTIRCYSLLRPNGTVSLLSGLMVNCHGSYAADNCPDKSVGAYFPAHTVAHQLRQSIRAPNRFRWQSMSGHMDGRVLAIDWEQPVCLRPVPCGQCSSARAHAADVAPRGPAAPRPSP